jgi:hypothetical protein
MGREEIARALVRRFRTPLAAEEHHAERRHDDKQHDWSDQQAADDDGCQRSLHLATDAVEIAAGNRPNDLARGADSTGDRRGSTCSAWAALKPQDVVARNASRR